MSVDPYSAHTKSLTSPADTAAAIEPSDVNDIAETSRGVYVGHGGTLVAILASDADPTTFANVSAGSVLPLRVRRVMATGATASGLVALG